MKLLSKSIIGVSTLLLLASCNHKDLNYGSAEFKVVHVEFDWKDAPSAHPGSMALYLYPTDGDHVLRFEFSGREGGSIRVPFGTYDALCISSDNTDWLYTDNMDARYTFAVSVGELTPVSETEESNYAALMKQVGMMYDGNAVDENPRAFWTGSTDSFTVYPTPEAQTLTIVPEDPLCYYSVDVLDVEGIEDTDGEGIPAILTGMSDGVDALTRTASTNQVSSPFILREVTKAETNALHAEFTTFGEDLKSQPVHKLNVMVKNSDGTWQQHTTEVTEQVRNAPDPRHVNIVVRGLKIPHSSTGGLTVDVNLWQTENVTLKM